VMNYLSPVSFGAVRGQLLSSLMTNEDTLKLNDQMGLLCFFLWKGPEDKEAFECVKIAEAQHATTSLVFEIEKAGIKMGEKYKE